MSLMKSKCGSFDSLLYKSWLIHIFHKDMMKQSIT